MDLDDPRFDSHDLCKTCGGSGMMTVPGHGCYGDSRICRTTCPVPEDDTCVMCGGTGFRELEDEGDPFP